MSQRSSSTAASSAQCDEKSDLEKALAYIEKEIGSLYCIYCFRKCQPLDHGFPIHRPRWYASRRNMRYLFTFAWLSGQLWTSEAVGILKGDGVPNKEDFEKICEDTMARTATPCTVDYFDFLSLSRPEIEFQRLHELPTHDATGFATKQETREQVT